MTKQKSVVTEYYLLHVKVVLGVKCLVVFLDSLTGWVM
jgi:hypothetical protein